MGSKGDSETEFSSDLLNLFSPHSKSSGTTTSKKAGSIFGWETCDDVHEEEMQFECATNRPYAALQLMQMSLADSEETAGDVLSRPTSVNGEIKRRNKTLSSLNVAIRRSKSSRCLQSGPPASIIRSWGSSFNPGIRYDTRFPMLFHGIREIKYEFRPFCHHQQHVDAYRNSYTYTLIRNFRELRNSGTLGNRCQAALRFNISAGSNCSKHKDKQTRAHGCRTPQRKKRKNNSLNQSPVVFYTDQCQTGPVVNLRGTKICTKGGEFLSPAVPPSGACFIPKSTMEINAVTLRPSQQRPFGEQDLQSKLEYACLKATKQSKILPGNIFCNKRRSNSGPVGIVAGTSALSRHNTSLSATRKVASLGKVPVAIRRSSPSIRGERDLVSGLDGVDRFLSIAVATHTVASPYHSHASQSQEDITLNADL